MIYKKKINFLLYFLLLTFSKSVFPCDCPSITKLNLDYCKQYKLIFRGTVQKIATCNEINHASFRIQELYKGETIKEFELYFDCSSDCKMNFNIGETWIIYANYIQLNKPKVELCSRSRKLVDNEIKLSTKYIANDLGFNEECEWLKQNLGIKTINKEENIKTVETHRNQLPEKEFSLVLILISLLFFLVLIYFLKKYF